MAFLKVTDASGRQAQQQLNARTTYTIGRAPDNQVVLYDPRAPGQPSQHARQREERTTELVLRGDRFRRGDQLQLNLALSRGRLVQRHSSSWQLADALTFASINNRRSSNLGGLVCG